MDDGTDDSLWAVPDGSTSALARPSATVDDFPDWNRTSLPIDAKSLLGEEFQQEMDVRCPLLCCCEYCPPVSDKLCLASERPARTPKSQ